MVIAHVSSDIWWGPALMAAVCIICTAGAMSIRSVRWGRGCSEDEEPHPVPGWRGAGWPPPASMNPPGMLPPQVASEGDPGPPEEGDSDGGGSEDGADGGPVLAVPVAQTVVQGRPVGGGSFSPPPQEWLESIPFGPSTPKRCQLLSDKGEAGTGRRWFVVRPHKCWPQPASGLAPGLYTEAALTRYVGLLSGGDRSALFHEQRLGGSQPVEALPPIIAYCQLLTAANHLSAAYEELRAYDIIPSSVPPVPLRILTR